MVIFYELAQIGMSHAPFTRAFVQMVAHASPGEAMRIYARQSHLDCAFPEPDALLDSRLEQVPFEPAETSFWGRMTDTLNLLRVSYGPLREQRPQVMFLTGEPHHIWAAKLYRMMTPGFRCHLVLHGDIHNLRAPRPRHPLRRMQDYFSSIRYLNHPDVRFIALETHIRSNIDLVLPGTAPFIDVIRHPCMPVTVDWRAANPADQEVRFGLLGIAGKSKGLDVFARLALMAPRDARRQPRFRLVGKVQAGSEQLDLSGIDGPLPFSKEWLPREIFDAEVARLHYVILPYNMDYYGLSASGVLLDVLRWRKPVIVFDTPVIRELSERFGDIGHICRDVDEMAAAVAGLLDGFDDARYARQCRNLDAAYHSRLPDAAAAEYVQIRSADQPVQFKAA